MKLLTSFTLVLLSLYVGYGQTLNDNPCSAAPIDVTATCNFETFSNVGANASMVNNPSCGGYSGQDVWFVTFVPASGNVTIELQAGTLDNMSMAVYSGNACDATLSEIQCDGNSGSGNMPRISLTGRTPGEYLYIRAWDRYSAGGLFQQADPLEEGDFGICAIEVESLSNAPGGSAPTGNCGNNNSPLGNTCDQAPTLCNLDGYCGSTVGYQANYWNDLGGSNLTASGEFNCGSIENNSFGKFIAGNSTVELEVTVNPDGYVFCNDGIQIMIFDGPCNGDVNRIMCESEDEDGGLSGNTEVYDYQINNLVPGQEYYIMIDGFAGDDCDYVLNAISGVAFDMYPSADQSICLGETVDLEVFLADGNSTWTGTGLNSTTGDQVTATPPSVGTYTYTVTSNPMTTSCGSSGTESFDITVTVSAPPSINLSAGACNASREIIVSASGGTSYTWEPNADLDMSSGSDVVFTGLNQTTLTVSGTDNNGCVTTESIIIDPCPIPCEDPTFSYSNSCGSSDVVVENLSISSGTFAFNPLPTDGASINASTGTISNPASGSTYTVEYTLTTSCGPRTGSATYTNLGACGPSICTSGNNLNASNGATFTWYEWRTETRQSNDCAECGGTNLVFTCLGATLPCDITESGWHLIGTGATIASSAFVDAANNPIKVENENAYQDSIGNFGLAITCGGCANPVMSVQPLVSCQDVELSNGVVSSGGGVVSYHASQAEADAGSNPITFLTVSSSGTYYVRSEDPSNALCYSTAILDVTISPISIAVSSNNPTDCGVPDGELVITVPTADVNYTVDVDGTDLGSILAIGNTIVVSGYSGGDVVNAVSLVEDLTGCQASDNSGWSFTDPGAPIVDAGSDIDICAGESISITATTTSGNLDWDVVSGAVLAASPNITTIFTATATDGNCTGTDQVEVTVYALPDSGITRANDTICFGDAITLSAAAGSGYDYSWSTGETTESISVSPVDLTPYALTITDPVSGCSSDSAFFIHVVDQPIVSIDQVDTTVCVGNQVVLTAVGNGEVTWPDGTSGSTFTVDVLGNTDIVVSVQAACGNTVYDTISITASTGPAVDAGEDGSILNGDSYQIDATVDPGYTIIWSPSGSLTCEDCEDPIASPTSTTTYYITVDPTSDCPGIDSVTVYLEIDETIWWPNAITGSGEDCCFGFETDLNLEGYYLRIYNRWGELVFESTDQQETWNGTFRGKELDTGVYTFVMNYTDAVGENQSVGGNITLIR